MQLGWLREFLRGGELRVAIGRTPPRAPPIGHRVPRAVPCARWHRGCARCSPDDTDSNGRLRCFASWLGNLTALPSLRTLPRFRSSLGTSRLFLLSARFLAFAPRWETSRLFLLSARFLAFAPRWETSRPFLLSARFLAFAPRWGTSRNFFAPRPG